MTMRYKNTCDVKQQGLLPMSVISLSNRKYCLCRAKISVLEYLLHNNVIAIH